MITINLNEDVLTAALQSLSMAVENPSGTMNEIADFLVKQTEKRFADEKGPDGTPWAPRSPVTLARYGKLGLSFGGVLRQSGQLANNLSIGYGRDFAEVASSEPYAAMMLFGGTKAAFPHLWGDIPARPFMGISDEVREGILEIISEALAGAFRQP